MPPTAESPSDASTRQRLLHTAAQLFAVHGFDNVSLRDLTTAAATNLAAVNYHFGSKDGLVDELVADFLNPLNAERLARLDEAEARFALLLCERFWTRFCDPRSQRSGGPTCLRCFSSSSWPAALATE